MGKMELKPLYRHDNKPSDVTLNDGRVAKSIQGSDSDTQVWTRVIRMK